MRKKFSKGDDKALHLEPKMMECLAGELMHYLVNRVDELFPQSIAHDGKNLCASCSLALLARLAKVIMDESGYDLNDKLAYHNFMASYHQRKATDTAIIILREDEGLTIHILEMDDDDYFNKQ